MIREKYAYICLTWRSKFKDEKKENILWNFSSRRHENEKKIYKKEEREKYDGKKQMFVYEIVELDKNSIIIENEV